MNWKKVKLNNLVAISKGKKHSETNNSADFRYIQIEDLNGSYTNKFTNEKGVEVNFNDVIIAWDGANAGKVGTGINGIIGSTLARIRPINGQPVGNYLFRYLQSQESEIKSKRTGATIPHINGVELKGMAIPLPDLPTQQRIAAILDKADTLRKADAELLGKYDDLQQTSFLQLFGNSEEMKRKYPLKKLYAVSNVVSGVAKNTKGYKEDFIEVPYMRVANVQDGHISLNEIKTIKVSKQDFDRYLLQKNDILLTEGGDPDKLGRGAVWHDEISPCIHQNHIFRVRPNDKELDAAYLSHHIGSGYGKKYFLKAAKQTTGIASINMTQLKNFDVIAPPIRLQKQFAEISSFIDDQKFIVQQQQQQSESLFQSLLQRAFKGEL